VIGDIVERLQAEVVPCPGKGLDGNGMQHCAECCFGSGVQATTDAELRIMLLARDAAATIATLANEIAAERAEVERLRAAGDALYEVADEWPELVEAWQEARRDR
jgi:hypothetical protein